VNRNLTRVAMTTAGIMLAHQVAAKAFRDATFLTAWPATALPLMMVATATATIALVPIFSRLLDRFSPLAVVAAGFALSALGHVAEWALFDGSRWIAVAIYLHLAAAGAVLLSGFWSLVSERFDPAGARAAYGRISAAGTMGGIAGSFSAERIAATISPDSVLLLLAVLHLICAGGVVLMRRAPALLPRRPEVDEEVSGISELLRSSYLRTIASFVVMTSASAAILDFVLKSSAQASFGAGPDLLRFFALYYGAVQVLSFLAQTRSGQAIKRFGIGGTINALPGGITVASIFVLVFQGWIAIAALRAFESVLRTSLFRSGYELLFVPMASGTRRRAKGILDVICDRVGEAAGSGIVQLLLFAGVASTTSSLLTVSLILAAASLWLGQRFGPLYLNLIERELAKYREAPQVSLVSEAGWTLLDAPASSASAAAGAAPVAVTTGDVAPRLDSQVQALADLRSRDLSRVAAALKRASSFGRIHVAQIIDLLASDGVLPAARRALEQQAPFHLGMLIDALVDPASDFVIRRRLPRIIGTVGSRRSLEGLVDGLNDARFEVRYYCSRAIARIVTSNPELSLDRARIIAVVERELSVPPQRWRGYRLLDRPDVEEPATSSAPTADSSRFREHILLLLATIVGRQPLDAAVQGVRSANAGVRGLAAEYLDHVLPPAVVDRLNSMLASTLPGVDVSA
jgi:ATP:ADP antiporter, AAA family